MKKTTITIDGREYPCRVTMGAMLRFKRLTGRDVSDIKATDLEDLVTLLWCCVASACKADGIEMPWNDEEFADHLEAGGFEAFCLTLGGEKKRAATKTGQPT